MKLDKLLFHVGMGKTGSSSIQWFLTRNAHKLARSKIFYPKGREFLVSGAHHPVAALFTESVAQGELTSEQRQRITALLDQYRKSGCSTLLLSTEFASRKCAKALSILFPDFEPTIIFYLRPQEDFIDSVINQQVKTYKTRLTSLDVTDSHMSMASYLPLLDAWADVVGTENLTVRRLNQKYLVGGSLFRDIYSLTGCELPFDKREFIEPPGAINKSLSRESIEVLVSINKYPLIPEDHQRLVLYMQKFGDLGSTKLLGKEQRQQIHDAFKEENKKIARKYLLGAESLF